MDLSMNRVTPQAQQARQNDKKSRRTEGGMKGNRLAIPNWLLTLHKRNGGAL